MNQKTTFMKIASVLFLSLVISLSTFAQVTSSAITGVISDSKGEGLPGTTIVAVHEPTGTKYGTISDANGRFTFPSIKVGGPYKVSVSYIGFQNQEKTGIIAGLGASVIVNFKMTEDGKLLEDIVISATKSDVFNANKTGTATNISKEAIAQLPTIRREIGDYTRLTPQASGNSFAGRDGRYNNLQIDGANFNNGFGLSSEPLPGGGGLSIDAIEEIQVNVAPYDVRQAGFTGAGINAVTKSGTNTFVGSVYNFFRNENLIGQKIKGLDVPGIQASSSNTYGFRFGGPLVKDKLFFFVNAEKINLQGPAAGAVNLWTASADGVANQANNITRVRRTDMEAVRNHLINQWNYDPGRYEGYANGEGGTSSFLGRLDWNINAKHTLSVRYNQTESNTPNLANGNSGPFPRSTTANRVSLNSMAFENTMYNQTSSVNSVSTELNSRISNKLTNQFLATYSNIKSIRTSQSPLFPFIDIGDGKGTTSTFVNYISAGYELFSLNNGVINDNINIFNNLNYSLGKHNLLFGASFEMQKFGNSFQRMGTSYYRYASVDDFLKTGTPQEVAPIQFGLTYVYPGMDPFASAIYNLPSLYVQDNFNVNSKLNVTLGLRAEMPYFSNNLTANKAVDDLKLLDVDGNERNYFSSKWPKSRVLFSPRVGFRYNASENNSLVIRGGAGIFTGRVPFVWLTNQPTNLGVIQNTIEPGSYAASSAWIGDIRFNPEREHWLNNTPASAQRVFIKSPLGGVPGTVALVDENFRMPQIFRFNLGVDKKLGNSPFTLVGDFMYSKDINNVYQFGANRKTSTTKMYDGREFYTNAAAYTHNPAIGGNSVSILTNTNLGYGYTATIGVNMANWKGLSGSLHYNHTSNFTGSDNNGSNALSAWGGTPNQNNPNDLFLAQSNGAIPNRIIGTLAYKITYGKAFSTTVSLLYDGFNQGRYSFTYNGDVNGDAIAGDLFFIPNKASDVNFVVIPASGNNPAITVQQQVDALDKLMASNKYLDKNRGQMAERNGVVMPFLNRFDFRVLQDIFVNLGKNKNSLQLSMDVANLGNLLNSNWGIGQTLIQQGIQPLQVVTRGEKPTFRMSTFSNQLPSDIVVDQSSFGTTWSMQLGLRYNFN
jgi:hypothetical protein